tara:strand:+ start:247 stop:387 length:141 start_codon:yes stop_codon:yes gene_type:complete
VSYNKKRGFLLFFLNPQLFYLIKVPEYILEFSQKREQKSSLSLKKD